VLARAGLDRLGHILRDGSVRSESGPLAMEGIGAWMVPAPGQGAVALETRAEDTELLDLIGNAGDAATLACVTAEREFLRLVGGGCHHPVGAHARVEADRLHLTALCFEADPEPRHGACAGPIADPVTLAAALHAQLYAQV